MRSRHRLLALPFIFVMIVVAWVRFPRTAVIEWNELHQVIDGFGASAANFLEPLPPEMADFFFATSGLGLSLLRIQVVPSTGDCKSQFVPYAEQCLEVHAGATILKGELAIARQAAERGVIVWGTPWSPPATMKSNGSYTNGGRLLPAFYPAWASSLADFVKLLKSNGVPIYALSVQNEPDLATNYGSSMFSAQEMHDFVPYLHRALEVRGVENTKIIIAEESHWDFSLTDTAMKDPTIAASVGILAAHGYGSRRIFEPKCYGKHVWQTEDSSQSVVYDGDIKDALSWAIKIHNYLTVAEVNAWHWWSLSDGPKYGNGDDNAALTDIGLNYPKRTYMTGQWSKFVRPGWRRIGVSYHGPLKISAFKASDGHEFAIVVVNPTGKEVTQAFSLDGFSAQTITAWVTSANLSLAVQPPVQLKGEWLTYRLPPLSITTLSGRALVSNRS